MRNWLQGGGLDRGGGGGGGLRGGRRDGRPGRPSRGPPPRVPRAALHPLPRAREARHRQPLHLVFPILPGAVAGRPAGGLWEAEEVAVAGQAFVLNGRPQPWPPEPGPSLPRGRGGGRSFQG